MLWVDRCLRDTHQTPSHDFLYDATGPVPSSHQCAQSYGSLLLDGGHQADSERSKLPLRVADLTLDRAHVLVGVEIEAGGLGLMS